MTAPVRPHTYLALRRASEGLSIDDVAAAIATEPRLPLHERRAWLERIEAGVDPISLIDVAVLRTVIDFDLDVLLDLAEVEAGFHVAPPQVCRVCGCSEDDPCLDDRGDACAWAAVDLCDAETCRAAAAAERAAA